MSFPPITIPDLDPASSINPSTDLILIRQGLNDRKATLSQISNIDLSSYTTITGAPLSTDVFIVGRNIGGGNYQNYKMLTENVTFIAGTLMWFYSQAAPLGWKILSNQGDRILSVISDNGTGIYNSTGPKGTWQQDGHVLTVNELAEHSHKVNASHTSTKGGDLNTNISRYGYNYNVGPDITTTKTGSNLAHNHGFAWRPAAACGRICEKL
ncbi:MAG: hypothetical protein ABI417_21370 [Coleofasciculaceae cyanobacterium]